jgi:hypothetical protein
LLPRNPGIEIHHEDEKQLISDQQYRGLSREAIVVDHGVDSGDREQTYQMHLRGSGMASIKP